MSEIRAPVAGQSPQHAQRRPAAAHPWRSPIGTAGNSRLSAEWLAADWEVPHRGVPFCRGASRRPGNSFGQEEWLAC